MPRKMQIEKDGVWSDCHMEDLQEGMIFRMFEEDGKPVIYVMKAKDSDNTLNAHKFKVNSVASIDVNPIWLETQSIE